MKKKFLTALFILTTIVASAQYEDRDSNRIGIIVGINQMTLQTNNFDTKPEMGWNLGLSVRGNFYNDFDMVYALQFSENKFSVPTHNAAFQKEDVAFKLPSAQISLMLSYKIVENHLSIEFGPVFQIGDKFKIDNDKAANTIDDAALKADGTALVAGDVLKIARFNFYPAIGITAGVRHFRANLQYQYGVTNILGKLNDSNNGMSGFKGNAGILSGNLLIYL
jgi:outer membrane protein with beta-barrel domain